MTALGWLAMVVVALGLASVGVGLVARRQQRERQLATILGHAPRGAGWASEDDQSAFMTSGIDLANRVVDQVDSRGGLHRRLDSARIPVRPGEFVVIVACLTFAAAAVLGLLTATWIAPVVVVLAAPVASRAFLDHRARARVRAFAAQLPDTLSVLSASLDAGHTFLRAIQMICEETDAPMSEELGRVVSETQLGSPLVEALERMAQRIPLRDVDWIVQAIRIQQTVGGRLAELLSTLAEFIRAREEVRREVAALTAEGRISAWVVGAIPVALFVISEVIQPEYMSPMLHGWGPAWLGLTALSVITGMLIIRRMVSQVEV